MVSSTPRPHFTPGKDPVPTVQEAVWDPGPVWKGGKSRPHRDSILERPARSSVAIPTELTGPLVIFYRQSFNNEMLGEYLDSKRKKVRKFYKEKHYKVLYC